MFADVPPEIRQEIYKFACTDDGATGRALSFVSKWVQKESNKFKYYSIHIRGSRQIFRFAHTLKMLEDEERSKTWPPNPQNPHNIPVKLPEVKHLVICNELDYPPVFKSTSPKIQNAVIVNGKRAVQTLVDIMIPCMNSKEKRQIKRSEQDVEDNNREQMVLQERQRHRERLLADVGAILDRLRPCLCNLHVDMDSHWFASRNPRIMYTAFSRLKSLTISYKVLMALQRNGVLVTDLPNLKYLDLMSVDLVHVNPFESLQDDLRKVAPRLTHIRIPQSLFPFVPWSNRHACPISILDEEQDPSENPRLLPANIKHIFIQFWGHITGSYRDWRAIDPRIVLVEADDRDMDIVEVAWKYDTGG